MKTCQRITLFITKDTGQGHLCVSESLDTDELAQLTVDVQCTLCNGRDTRTCLCASFGEAFGGLDTKTWNKQRLSNRGTGTMFQKKGTVVFVCEQLKNPSQCSRSHRCHPGFVQWHRSGCELDLRDCKTCKDSLPFSATEALLVKGRFALFVVMILWVDMDIALLCPAFFMFHLRVICESTDTHHLSASQCLSNVISFFVLAWCEWICRKTTFWPDPGKEVFQYIGAGKFHAYVLPRRHICQDLWLRPKL